MNKRGEHTDGGVRRYPRLVKWTFRFFSGIAVAVLYFAVFSVFFDTPIEYELKKSTDRIEAEYRELERRYDTLQQVLDNVSERDRSVYKMLFEAEPAVAGDEDRQRRLAVRSRLEEMTNLELGTWFDEHLGLLYQQVSNYGAMSGRMQERVAKDVRAVLSIPAIQPVDNRQLTLLTASFGERVHPFSNHDATRRGGLFGADGHGGVRYGGRYGAQFADAGPDVGTESGDRSWERL